MSTVALLGCLVTSRGRSASLVVANAFLFLVGCHAHPYQEPGTKSDAGDTPDGAAVDHGADTDKAVDGPPVKPSNIIDNMEREDMAKDFVSPAGVLASWHAVANFAVGQQPLQSDAAIIQRLSLLRGGSSRGAMLLAPELEDGADLFIDFHPATIGGPDFEHVDFSEFTGIAFWARSGSATYPFIVAIKDDQLSGGNEEFFAGELLSVPWFSALGVIGPEWTRYEIRFNQFARGLQGNSGHTPHANAIRSIHFIASPHVPFELWIDDLVLTCAGPCPG